MGKGASGETREWGETLYKGRKLRDSSTTDPDHQQHAVTGSPNRGGFCNGKTLRFKI